MAEVISAKHSFLGFFTGTTLGVVVGIGIVLCCCVSTCAGLYVLSQGSASPYLANNGQQTGTTSSTSQTFSEGDTVSFKGLNITVNSSDSYVSDNQYFVPKSGYEYLAVEVTVENVNAEQSGYGNPFNFSLKDADGYTYNDVLLGKEPSIKSDDIAKGQKTRGFLTFEVPTNHAKLQLKYSPTFFSDSVTIDLK